MQRRAERYRNKRYQTDRNRALVKACSEAAGLNPLKIEAWEMTYLKALARTEYPYNLTKQQTNTASRLLGRMGIHVTSI